MFRNYIVEADLINIVPELSSAYKFTGQTDFSGQKTTAEQIVATDLINKGFKANTLRPDLSLRTSTTSITADENGTISDEDNTGSMLRVVANVTALTTPNSILTLQGTNDDGDNYTDIATLTPTATGITSGVFLLAHKKYRINTNVTAPGAITYQSWLTEIKFDNLFRCKWLELIFMNTGKGKENKYTEYAEYWREEYNKELSTGDFWLDTQVTGDVNDADKTNAVNVRFGR